MDKVVSENAVSRALMQIDERLGVELERIPKASWPVFVRGDISWGSESFMSSAEEKGVYEWGWGGFTTNDLKRCRIMARQTTNHYQRSCKEGQDSKGIERITSLFTDTKIKCRAVDRSFVTYFPIEIRMRWST